MILLSEYCRILFGLANDINVTDSVKRTLSPDEGAQKVVEMLRELKVAGKKAMIVGNGGSAAIAGHMHNDLAKAAGIRALSFQDISWLTAMANDHGYEAAYEAGVMQWAEKNDLLITISSSGESENMLSAVLAARRVACRVVTLSGFSEGNSLRKLGDINFYVPVMDYGYVETIHSLLAHYLTDMAKKNM